MTDTDQDTADIDAVLDAIDEAQAQALADHLSGACRSSEWSCSHCEQDQR